MKYLALLILILCALSLNAQITNRVIKVNGTIEIVKTGVELETGTVFNDDEKLDFETPSAKAAVINSKKGRMIIQSGEASSGYNLLPPLSNISKRSISLKNELDLKNYYNGKLVLLDKIVIMVSLEVYPMNENNFFYLYYRNKGEEVNKKLSYDDNKLIINKDEVLLVDNKAIKRMDNEYVRLYYRANSVDKLISSFTLSIPNYEYLKKEVKMIIDYAEGKPTKEIIDNVLSYITEFYGKTTRKDVERWVKGNFNI